MTKEEAKESIEKFFKSKQDREKVRKMRKLAMSHNIKLGAKRKLFCKRCNSMNLRVLGIKRGIKRVICKDCDSISRYEIKERR